MIIVISKFCIQDFLFINTQKWGWESYFIIPIKNFIKPLNMILIY